MKHAWPMVARLLSRLMDLRNSWTELSGFSEQCLRGDPDSDTLLLDYSGAGLRLELRFDRGVARRQFPLLSVCDFGNAQISRMTVEGPPTARFRDLENALWGIVYDEAVRFEKEADVIESSDAPEA